MSPQTKKLIIAGVVIALAVSGYFALTKDSGPKSIEELEGESEELPNTYSNPNAGFGIRYSTDMDLIVDRSKISPMGLIPVCDPETTIACIVFPKENLPGRNFNLAAVSVSILIDKDDEEKCLEADNESTEKGEVTIGGEEFMSFEYEDAATSQQVRGVNLRSFNSDQCYQISTRIFTSTFEVHAPGTVARFTDEERAALEQKLDAVANSFRFLD